MSNKIEDGEFLNELSGAIPPVQAEPSITPSPSTGGSYLRDPQTGELVQLVAPPEAALRKQSTKE